MKKLFLSKKTWRLGDLAFFYFLILMMTLSACSSFDNLMVTSTPVILTETPPPTSTRIWFPPSATSSPQPFSLTDKAPTPEMRPNIGNILLEDNFSDETLWDIASSNQASSAINNNRLILSAQSGVYMLSLRHEIILNDYYVEITAQPSLCRGEDNYGLLIRASASTYYRFVLACNGTARAERITNGARLILQQPLQSGDVPPGAPGNVRMAVWAVGREIRLFLNDRFQFSITDPSFPSGTVGVFVRSVGSTPVIVSFSDLIVREVNE